MSAWAASLPTGQRSALAHLRLVPNIQFAEVSGTCWLRGETLDDQLEQELKKVPGIERFELLSTDRLRPVGSRIPSHRLPPATWRPIKEALPLTLPIAALPGKTSQRIPIVLVRTSEELPAAAIRITLNQWVEYASAAPLVRLETLRFAASENRDVLVLGTPLPALMGRRYSVNAGILVPCGFTWSPPADPRVLRQLFNLRAEDLVVLGEDNTHQVVPNEQFFPATRSAARQTLEQCREIP